MKFSLDSIERSSLLKVLLKKTELQQIMKSEFEMGHTEILLTWITMACTPCIGKILHSSFLDVGTDLSE